MKISCRSVLAFVLLSAITTGSVFAQVAAPLQFTFDEAGNGSGPGGPIPGVMLPDPISGLVGLSYGLPFAVAPGDLLVFESATNQEHSDLVRFFQNRIWFFSDNTDPGGDLADVGIPPVGTFGPVVTLIETGVEGGLQGFTWIPLPGQPGDAGAGLPPGGVQYNFISDIPEPTSLLAASLGGAVLMLSRRRCRR